MANPTSLPSVDHITGALLHRDATEQTSRVLIQYTDHNGTLYELWVPLQDAMYLRNILNQVESDCGFGRFDMPRS